MSTMESILELIGEYNQMIIENDSIIEKGIDVFEAQTENVVLENVINDLEALI
jgi:hypothetical protein